MMWSALIALCLAALGVYSVFRGARRSVIDQVFSLFGLDAADYELLGFDLGGASSKLVLRGDGLVGAPDAVFRHRRDGHVLIGDFKSRRFRGSVSAYERFQMVLYQGVARSRFGAPVKGLLRYACGHLEPVVFDPETYAELRSLIPALRSIQARFPASPSARRSRKWRLAAPR